MKTYIFIFLISIFSVSLFAAPAGVKNEDGSFKLTEKALSTIGVKFLTLKDQGPWTLPAEAMVKIKFTEGVYRRYEGDITFVIVKVLNRNSNTVQVTSADLEVGDEVAVEGVTLLRLTEADLNSDTVDSCAH